MSIACLRDAWLVFFFSLQPESVTKSLTGIAYSLFIYCVIWQEQVPCAWTHAFDSGMLCLWNTAICIFNISQDSKCILSLAVRYTDILQNLNSWCPWNALVSNHVPGFSPLSLRPVGPERPEGLGRLGVLWPQAQAKSRDNLMTHRASPLWPAMRLLNGCTQGPKVFFSFLIRIALLGYHPFWDKTIWHVPSDLQNEEQETEVEQGWKMLSEAESVNVHETSWVLKPFFSHADWFALPFRIARRSRNLECT